MLEPCSCGSLSVLFSASVSVAVAVTVLFSASFSVAVSASVSDSQGSHPFLRTALGTEIKHNMPEINTSQKLSSKSQTDLDVLGLLEGNVSQLPDMKLLKFQTLSDDP